MTYKEILQKLKAKEITVQTAKRMLEQQKQEKTRQKTQEKTQKQKTEQEKNQKREQKTSPAASVPLSTAQKPARDVPAPVDYAPEKKGDQTGNGKKIQLTFNTYKNSAQSAPGKVRLLDNHIKRPGGQAKNEPIAIIGMSGRYPGAPDVGQFWDNLKQKKDSITEIPPSRWNVMDYFQPLPQKEGKIYCKWGGLLDNIADFDPYFFMISPAEAELMDPQQRIFLQEGYRAFEDAGYCKKTLDNTKCGIYLGMMHNEYSRLIPGNSSTIAASTGNSYAIASARLAYFLNLKGPALTLDTACSSSLVAAHLACSALAANEVDIALAGGVTLYLTPGSYISMCSGGMLSPDGRCSSFDSGANGFVPGEGAGAVVLKRLGDAEKAGDHIYGIIIGSAVNQDGKTNGITAPSMNSQIALIDKVYNKYGIDPETISYVETHGTGTKLGDPIELEALSTVFKKKTGKKGFCALGAVKSNIGHTSAAAGVAGIHKVLLSLQHKQIAPSLHFNRPNEHFIFENSPFYVNTELSGWEKNRDKPRRAAVSCFGISGTNAHMVIEEYTGRASEKSIPNERTFVSPNRELCFVLSAEGESQLVRYAEKVKNFIETGSTVDLTDLVYTFQTGRDVMEYRLAFSIGSRQELVEKLAAFINRREKSGIFHGRCKGEKPGERSHDWIKMKEYGKIAEAWVKGLEPDWNLLYENKRPRRISAPTYPFTKEAYWVEAPQQELPLPGHGGTLGPLLHENVSDFTEQKFRSVFTGHEFFLRDHVVGTHKVLPGVAYLELAVRALEHSFTIPGEEINRIKLRDVFWMVPVVVKESPVEIFTGLTPGENGGITITIYSNPGDRSEQIIHFMGKGEITAAGPDSPVFSPSGEARQNGQTLSSEKCYGLFETLGIHYGPGHRGVKTITVSPGMVRGRLELPAFLTGPFDSYILHPAMMDSALQIYVGLLPDAAFFNRRASGEPALPFALEELEIFGPIDTSMESVIQYNKKSSPEGRIDKYDAKILYPDGRLCIRMKGLSLKERSAAKENNPPSGPALDKTKEKGAGKKETGEKKLTGNILMAPVWDFEEWTGENPDSKQQQTPLLPEKTVITGFNKDFITAFQKFFPEAPFLEIKPSDSIDTVSRALENFSADKGPGIDELFFIAPFTGPAEKKGFLFDDSLLSAQEKGLLSFFKIIKGLLKLGFDKKPLRITVCTFQTQQVIPGEKTDPVHGGLHGFAGSLAKEYPGWKVKIVDLDSKTGFPLKKITRLPFDYQGHSYALRENRLYRQHLLYTSPYTPEKTLYRKNGVYIVIGGAGGIGEAWSAYMIKTYNAHIYWLGRREEDEKIRSKIKALSAFGPAPRYISCDASSKKELSRALNEIKKEHQTVNGIIHSAIQLLDENIQEMGLEDFQNSFYTKAGVSLRIGQVFKKENPDFILFFSSLISVIKNPGQSAYAAGSVFQDNYAHQLAREFSCKVKVINWGYWMREDVANMEDFRRVSSVGIGLIEPEDAMPVLEGLLAGPLDQIALIKTTKPLGVEGLVTDETVSVLPAAAFSQIEASPEKAAKIETVKKTLEKAPPPAENLLPEITGFKNELDTILHKLLLVQLDQLGIFADSASPTLRVLKEQYGLNGLYDRWWEESITALQEKGYINLDTEGVISRTETSFSREEKRAIWEEWENHKKEWLQTEDLKAQVLFVESTVKNLPAILSGTKKAAEVIFPDSSMDHIEGTYKNNRVSDFFNDRAALAVKTYIQSVLEENPGAQIRICEIGAGTGGTSQCMFKELQRYKKQIAEYCYTDLSQAFLLHAREKYGPQAPYLTYKLFNVEQSPVLQDMDTGCYDIVIATNVLHATRNMSVTLRNTKSLLKNGGIVVINELSKNTLFTHLSFGLLEGWWLYEDRSIRIKGCPGLSGSTWQTLLETEGYRDVFLPAADYHTLGQQIIIAESNGIIRQKDIPKPVQTPTQQETYTTQAAQTADKALSAPVQVANSGSSTGESAENLREHCVHYLKETVGEILKIPADRFDPSQPLERYGIDSILIVHLTNKLQKVFKSVNSTTFFEYQTLDALADHFLETEQESLHNLFGTTETGETGGPGESQQAYHSQTVIETRTALPAGSIKPGRFLSSPSAVKPAQTNRISREVVDIAVIGLSGKYAGADNLKELWKNLKAGKNCITQIPHERWNPGDYSDTSDGIWGPIYTPWGGFIKGIDLFDPLFFRIAPAEAERMDPQERLFLQTVYASIEDAGYRPEDLSSTGKVGVFAGVMNGNYATGANYASVANRISYIFDFHGPSMTLDTACSSSLTALHLALENLYSGVCEICIAGGVNLIVSPVHYQKLCAMKMLSSGPECKSFGENADGFVDGEGVGALILKPLAKAEADGDHIYGIIKGSALNHGGKTNGYTVPNPAAQADLIRETFKRAGITPERITYIEAHGTGTSLGDPIEIAGLTKSFSLSSKEKNGEQKNVCAIGSIKSNIGHCESAAGIAGITKVLLQMQQGKLVPSLHSENTNPFIDFSKTPFFVQQELSEWEKPQINGISYPRCAGVSSFGAGGANAHVIIEEYENHRQSNSPPVTDIHNPALFVLSARTGEQLIQKAKDLLDNLTSLEEKGTNLADLVYTLQAGREAMKERLAFTITSWTDLQEKLTACTNEQESSRASREVYRNFGRINETSSDLLSSDDDMDHIIRSWIEKRKYSKLLKLWVSGIEVNWDLLYEGRQPCRVSLPAYPFAREPYWLENTVQPAVSQGAVSQKVKEKQTGEHNRFLSLYPEWTDLSNHKKEPDHTLSDYRRIVIFIEMDEIQKELTGNPIPGVTSIFLSPETDIQDQKAENTLDKRFTAYTSGIFEIVRQHMLNRGDTRLLIQVVLPYEGEKTALNGIFGLLQTVWLENPRILSQMIEVETGCDAASISSILLEHSHFPLERRLRYREGKPSVLQWKETGPFDSLNLKPWKNGGVYLITGGAGGIGRLFIEEIISSVQEGTIIVCGRSQHTDSLTHFSTEHIKVEYRQTDVTDKKSAAALISSIIEDYGSLQGIIHSAGIIKDGYILKKKAGELKEVLAPKVAGLINIDEAARDVDLDFLYLFSSMAGVLGNIGQADYAAANAFMDGFCEYRNYLVEQNKRSGKTISINWPAWKKGGMAIDSTLGTLLEERTGMVPMEEKTGIDAFYKTAGSKGHQMLIMAGNLPKIRSYIKEVTSSIEKSPKKGSSTLAVGEDITEEVRQKVKTLFGDCLKLSADRIDGDETLDAYGLDSIMITGLNQSLETIFTGLSKTIILECNTLNILSDRLLKSYPDECRRWVEKRGSIKTVPVEENRPDLKEEYSPTGMETHQRQKQYEPIAVIGMSARFPGSDNINEYWENLKKGLGCISEIPGERWSLDSFFTEDPETAVREGKSYSKWGGFLKDFASFDPLFFSISPIDALQMDPQERLFLEECWCAFEDAGYISRELDSELRKKTGVFGAITKTGYSLWNSLPGPSPDSLSKNGDPAVLFTTSFSSMVNRVSYFLDIQGPSMPVDTMCSSSHSAIHLACEQLGQGAIQMALVGAVNLYLHPSNYYAMCRSRLIAASNNPEILSGRTNGFMPSEGAGAVVLKRLCDAKRDNDNIQAVIIGSAVNQNGRTGGYGIPNPARQKTVIEEALKKSPAEPESIGYMELAANGSKLGDAAEIEALSQVFGHTKQTGDRSRYRWGSVKPLIGHGEAVSGLAQIIKVILQLKHNTFLPVKTPEKLNKDIPLEKLPFSINSELTPWPALEQNGKLLPRRAGINSFGAGGVNAHIILEEYPEADQEKQTVENQCPCLFVLSAKTESSLVKMKKNWIEYLEKHPGIDLPRLTYTLQARRETMKFRTAIKAVNRETLIDALKKDQQTGQEQTTAGFIPAQIKQLEEYLQKGDLETLGQLWTAGYTVPWKRLYTSKPPVPLGGLPSYGFNRRRFWLQKEQQEQKQIDKQKEQQEAQQIEQPKERPRFISLDDLSEESEPTRADTEKDTEKATDTGTEENQNGPAKQAETEKISREEKFSEISRTMAAVLREVLYLDPDEPIDYDTNFVDFGLSSITTATFIQKINDHCTIHLRQTIVFDYTTINELTGYVLNEYLKE